MAEAPETPGIEGRLDIAISFDGGSVQNAKLTSSRPIGAVEMFHGKTIDQALTLMPVMFSLCGRAQTIAGLSAAEAAMGIQPTSGQRALRSLLVLVEALEQDAMRMALDWPQMIGRAPDIAPLQKLRKATASFTALVSRDPAWLALNGAEVALTTQALKEALVAIDLAVLEGFGKPDDLGQMQSSKDLALWAEKADGLIPAAISWAVDNAALGAAGIDVLGSPDLKQLDRDLRLQNDRDFEQLPHIDGLPRETGPVDMLTGHPLVEDYRTTFGLGLMTRLVARCLHLWQIPEKMRNIISLNDDISPSKDNDDIAERAAGSRGLEDENSLSEGTGKTGGGIIETYPGSERTGVAAVYTARGWLVHRIRLERESRLVLDYRTIAPTEWNFHPQGPLIEGLKGIQARDWAEIEAKAKALVTVLDPCVSFRITQAVG